MTITLSDEEQNRIDEFVDEMLANNKTSKQEDFRTAFFSGKGCEQALANFLNERYNLDASVDYDVYIGGDSTDLIPYQVEVKSIVGHGSRLAIPVNEAERIEEDEPIVAVKWHSLEEYELVGWCYKDELSIVEQGKKPWTQYADNLVTHESNLRQDWRECCTAMGASPGSTFSFSE